jgi:Uma2 family endonuclease
MQYLETKSLLLDVHSITLRVNHEEFEKLCQDNPDLRLELTKDGQLITMAPAGWESSKRNSKLNSRVDVWNEPVWVKYSTLQVASLYPMGQSDRPM